jgi:peptidyl-prolyl cis-trans isomerase B (cyclophilin B)
MREIKHIVGSRYLRPGVLRHLSAANKTSVFSDDFNLYVKDIKDDPKDKDAIKYLLEAFGTHLIVHGSLGGELELAMEMTSTETISEMDINAALNLSCGVVDGDASFTMTDDETNYVIIDIKGYGKMLVRLFPNVAPEAVKAFKQNVKDGYFNGKYFDLIIKHSFIQCNNNSENMQEIPGEFKASGFENNLSHIRGVLSLPRADEHTSDASSFFICTKASPALNSQHAAFGFVVYGAELIDEIASVAINDDQSPVTSITVNSIRFVKLP